MSSIPIVIVPSGDDSYKHAAFVYAALNNSPGDPIIRIAGSKDDEVKGPRLYLDVLPTGDEFSIENDDCILTKYPNEVAPYYIANGLTPLQAVWKYMQPDVALPKLLAILDVSPSPLFAVDGSVTHRFATQEAEGLYLLRRGMAERGFTKYKYLSSILRRPDSTNETTFTIATSSGRDVVNREYNRSDKIIENARVNIIDGYKVVIIEIPCWSMAQQVAGNYMNHVGRDHQLNKMQVMMLVASRNGASMVYVRSRSGLLQSLYTKHVANKTLIDGNQATFSFRNVALDEWDAWKTGRIVSEVRKAPDYNKGVDVYFPSVIPPNIQEALNIAAVEPKAVEPKAVVQQPEPQPQPQPQPEPEQKPSHVTKKERADNVDDKPVKLVEPEPEPQQSVPEPQPEPQPPKLQVEVDANPALAITVEQPVQTDLQQPVPEPQHQPKPQPESQQPVPEPQPEPQQPVVEQKVEQPIQPEPQQPEPQPEPQQPVVEQKVEQPLQPEPQQPEPQQPEQKQEDVVVVSPMLVVGSTDVVVGSQNLVLVCSQENEPESKLDGKPEPKPEPKLDDKSEDADETDGDLLAQLEKLDDAVEEIRVILEKQKKTISIILDIQKRQADVAAMKAQMEANEKIISDFMAIERK